MLKIKNLKLSYNDELIFKDLNLEARKSELVVITGHSGSGKSSLLKIINGIIPEVSEAKVEGEISYLNHDLLKEDIETRSNYLSTVFQNPKTQFYCINSSDELAFGLENRAIKREEIIKTIDKYTTLLKTQDLLNKDIFSLSGGEKQLLAITAVSCLNNDIYLFDEPSASLDRNAIKRLKEVIKILKAAGKIIIIAEHRLYYLKELLDQVFVIEDKQCYHYTQEVFLNDFDNIAIKHNLRAINEINRNDLKNIRQIKLIERGVIQNQNQEVARLDCLNFKISFEKPILDFSISFKPGIYFIIGENGVGKSTFVKTLCKLIKAKGKRYYNDKLIKKTYDYIAMVMQDVNYQIYTESCFEELSVISDKKDLILQSLDEVKLLNKKDVHPQTLSGGEKQRLLLAKAKVSTKPIIILDEPTSGLDKLQMESMIAFLNEMKRANKIVLVITHDYELIKNCAENVLEFTR